MGRPKKQASDDQPEKPAENKVKHDTEKNRKFIGDEDLSAISWKVSYNNGYLDCEFMTHDGHENDFFLGDYFNFSGEFSKNTNRQVKEFEKKLDTLRGELNTFHDSFVRMTKEYFKDELA